MIQVLEQYLHHLVMQLTVTSLTTTILYPSLFIEPKHPIDVLTSPIQIPCCPQHAATVDEECQHRGKVKIMAKYAMISVMDR